MRMYEFETFFYAKARYYTVDWIVLEVEVKKNGISLLALQ